MMLVMLSFKLSWLALENAFWRVFDSGTFGTLARSPYL
jgi:hypothetical protein